LHQNIYPMKSAISYSVFVFVLIIPIFLLSQNIGINENGNSANSSAILDVQSADKGLLVPRINIPNLNNAAPVTSPETSLLVWNTNTTTGVGYHYWDGTQWIRLSTTNGTVTAVTAENGLNSTGGTTPVIRLGGLIDQDPTIVNVAGNNLTFAGQTSKIAVGSGFPSPNSHIAGGDRNLALGNRAVVNGGEALALGFANTGNSTNTEAGTRSLAIGKNVQASGGSTGVNQVIAIGSDISNTTQGTMLLGMGSNALRINANNTSGGLTDNGRVDIINRIRIGTPGESGDVLTGSLLVGHGAPDVFTGAISLYSNRTGGAFQGGIRMHNATTGTGASRGGLIGLNGGDLLIRSLGNSDNIIFNNNNAERMRITANGRVGIGTNNPQQLLHLRGTALNLFLENPTGNNYTINSTDAGDLRFFRVGSSAFPLTIRGTNNFVGINNPTPNANLHVTGQTILDGTTTINTNGGSSGLRINHSVAGESLTINTNSANWCILAAISGVGTAHLNQFGNWIDVSDRNAKTNIRTIEYGLSDIMKLKPSHYEMKVDGKTTKIGFIAQELYETLPEVVDLPQKEDQSWGVHYGSITAVLTKAIQEQQAQIEALKLEVEQLKKDKQKD
jgi:hypothetical protein